jgi:hypothetical protein
MSARALAEYFEDQPRPVDDFGLPPPFEVALLDRAQCPIDDYEPDIVFADQLAEILERAAAEQAARTRVSDTRDLGADDIEADRLGKPYRLLQPSRDRAPRELDSPAARRRLRRWMQDKCSAGRGSVDCSGFSVAQGSAISLFCSNSWIGCAGITVEIACLYTSCECASRRNRTQKLSNQVMIPWSFTPFTRKIVTGVLFLRTWFKKTSWTFCDFSGVMGLPHSLLGTEPSQFMSMCSA